MGLGKKRRKIPELQWLCAHEEDARSGERDAGRPEKGKRSRDVKIYLGCGE